MKAICYGNFILRFTIMVFIIQMVLCPQSSYLYSLWYSAQVLYIIIIIILSIFHIFYSAQVRLHPSNIHYSGCVHSLVETISSRLKLVRSFLFKECTKQNDFSMHLIDSVSIVSSSSFADLCPGRDFGGLTSPRVIHLDKTETNTPFRPLTVVM